MMGIEFWAFSKYNKAAPCVKNVRFNSAAGSLGKNRHRILNINGVLLKIEIFKVFLFKSFLRKGTGINEEIDQYCFPQLLPEYLKAPRRQCFIL